MQGRKPVSSGVGRSAIWAAIRSLKKFEVKDLPATISTRTIKGYLTGLVKAGYVKRLGQLKDGAGLWKAGLYELVRDVGPVAPRVRRDGKTPVAGAIQDQLWRTMKIIKEFTAKDLAIHASTEQVNVSLSRSRAYCHYLMRAGYLAVIHAGAKGSPTVYLFMRSRNTGPRPPIVQQLGQVFDPNTNKVVWADEVRFGA